MNLHPEEPTLITLTAIARRWGVTEETARGYVKRGILHPAFGTRQSARYSLAAVKAVEQAEGCADVSLMPLTWEGRGSPAALLRRVEVAREAVELAARLDGGKAVDLDGVGAAALAVQTLIEGCTAMVPGLPVVGTSGAYGVSLQDPDAARDLARLAHAALAALTLSECRATLADLGPKMREQFTRELGRILNAAGVRA